MLSAVLEHYARYQTKKAKRGGLATNTSGEDSFSASNVLEVDSIYRSSINGSGIEFLVKDPICRGFLLAFSQECYNAENMLFLIEVEKFREALKPDKALWPGNYKEIDNLVAIDPSKEWKWRSRINLTSVNEHIKYIYDNFINEGAENQICVSTAVMKRTNERVALVAAYGRETFHEISIDPFRTLEKDILPRFVTSALYRTLCDRLDMLTHLPSGDTLVVEPPANETDLVMGSAFGVDRQFSLDEIIETKFLYTAFLNNLRAKMSSENLLCKRLIIIFKEKLGASNTAAAEAIAWDIYRYFVAAHSAFEVSLEYAHKTELKFNLAKPILSMFDSLNRSVTEQLNSNFSEFKRTNTYANLARDLQVEVEQRKKSESKGGKRGCLG